MNKKARNAEVSRLWAEQYKALNDAVESAKSRLAEFRHTIAGISCPYKPGDFVLLKDRYDLRIHGRIARVYYVRASGNDPDESGCDRCWEVHTQILRQNGTLGAYHSARSHGVARRVKTPANYKGKD